MIRTQVEKNKLLAFEHFVEVQKKQDKTTITVNDNEYSYVTKSGIIKRYMGLNSFGEYQKSSLYPQRAERVSGFVFVQIAN